MKFINKIEHLISLLEKAEEMISQYSGGYSDHFLSAEEFHNGVKKEIERLRNKDFDSVEKLYIWFAPSHDWDDFTNLEGLDLGNQIFAILSDII